MRSEGWEQTGTEPDGNGTVAHRGDAGCNGKGKARIETTCRATEAGCMVRLRQSMEHLRPALARLGLVSHRKGKDTQGEIVKKALLVGINAYPTSPLKGCLNDAVDLAALLRMRGYEAQDIKLLLDEQATQKGIMEGVYWLVNGTQAGDTIVFTYSGHGSQVRATGPDVEADELDEIIIPVDFNFRSNYITDDQLGLMFAGLPDGVNVWIVLDSCFSGTGTRQFEAEGKYRAERYMPPPAEFAGRGKVAGRMGRLSKRKARELASRKGCWPFSSGGSSSPSTPPDDSTMRHVLVSGCAENETSADAFIEGRYNGAMSWSLLKASQELGVVAASTVYARMTALLKSEAFGQHPQLEGSVAQKAMSLFA